MSEQTSRSPVLNRAASFRASSYNEADHTIEVVWTTGAAVRRRDWRNDEYYFEVLEVSERAIRLDRLNAGAPFLAAHDDTSLKSVIGSVVPGTARIEGGNGYARVALSRAPGDADVVSKIRDGVIRNISVGYLVHAVRVERRDSADDIWHVIDWEPFEISAVPIPADTGAQIRSDEVIEAPEVEFREAVEVFDDLDTEDLEFLRIAAKAAFEGSGSPEERADAGFREAYRMTRNHDDAMVVYGATLAWAINDAMGGPRLRVSEAADADDDMPEIGLYSHRPR